MSHFQQIKKVQIRVTEGRIWTGYAKSELRDARSRISPSADSQATAKRIGYCPLKAHHLPASKTGQLLFPLLNWIALNPQH